ncbi:MAG: hypothetical protein AAF211_06910 [Myxococcota bacterium]
MLQTAFQYDDAFDPSLWDPALTARLFAEHDADFDLVNLESLCHRASSHDGPLPTPLLETLYRIHDLANDAGYEALFAALVRAGCRDDPTDRSPADLALFAWLEHRTVFERVHARHVVPALGGFRVFRARAPCPTSLDEDAHHGLEQILSSAFQRRGLGAHCRIAVANDRHQLVLAVHRSRPLRRIAAISRDGEEVTAVRARQTDRLLYDVHSGLLRILASDPGVVQTYRRAFERVVLDEEDWLVENGVLSLQPLLDHGPGALLPIRGLREVQLREIELRIAHPDHESTVRMLGNDVFAVLEHYGRVKTSDGEPISATFALVPASGGRPRFLQLRLPNTLVYDWRRDDPVPFLEERGFLRGRGSGRGRWR